MCLIIQRKPNFVIPFEKFKTAVENNPDGYGLSFPNDNGLTVLRDASKPDVDKLYRMVNEELIDTDLMLHLRYTTAGDTVLRNAHPFPVLEKRTDGVDLRMAHNGTLHKWKPKGNKWESDTRNFVKSFVRPLFKRMIRGHDIKEIFSDSFLKDMLEDQLTASSVLTFLDSNGNSLICNGEGNGGKQEDGWYYSNTYSFNPSHRLPPVKTHSVVSYGAYGGYASDEYYRQGSAQSSAVYASKTLSEKTNVTKFSKKYSMDSVDELFGMSDDTIEAICKLPEDANLLIKELLFELQSARKGKKP